MDERRPKVKISMGWGSLEDPLSLETHTALGMAADGATIVVVTEALQVAGLCYAGEVRITAELDGREHPLFVGLVNKVEVTDGRARIELSGLQRDLESTSIGGLVVGDGTDGREVIHALMRMSGLPSERIQIEGWTGGPTESFLVAAPIAGISMSSAHPVGSALFTPTNPAQMAFPSGDLVTDFERGDAWASSIVEAQTLLEAEALGLGAIRLGVSLLRAFAFYSYPALDDDVGPFDWNQTRSQPEVRPQVFVGSVTTSRRWLRNVVDFESVEPLNLDAVRIPDATAAAHTLVSRRLSRALQEWHSAADATDDLDRVAHLWRSMECYTSGVKAERLFTPQQLREAQSAIEALGGWSEEQRHRAHEILGRLNEAPLLAKLKRALAVDDVEVTDGEFDALARTRSLRNQLEHGTELSAAEHRSLDLALAVTNRILVKAVLGTTVS